VSAEVIQCDLEPHIVKMPVKASRDLQHEPTTSSIKTLKEVVKAAFKQQNCAQPSNFQLGWLRSAM